MTDFYRSRFRFIFLFWLTLIAISSSAAELDLRANNSFYSWQPLGDSGNSVNQMTQDIRLRLSESDLSLRLNLSNRIDLDAAASRVRVREAYLGWQLPLPKVTLRLGRCYPLMGSSTGKMDGVDLGVRASPNLLLGGFAGAASKDYRSNGKINFDHFRTGAGFLYNRLPRFRLEGYAAHEIYKGETYKQTLGFSGYASPFFRLTSYSYASVDLLNRRLSSFIARLEYELIWKLSAFSEYAYRSPLIRLTEGAQVPLTGSKNRLPIYREVSFGVDLRVLRLVSLRAEGGGDRILGSDALIGNLRLSALDFLHTGLDVLAGYGIRSRSDSMREIYSITVSRSIGKRVTVGGDFSQLQYRFDRAANEYHTQSAGLSVSYLIFRSIDVSLDVEGTRHEGDLRDVRIFANVGYALGGYQRAIILD